MFLSPLTPSGHLQIQPYRTWLPSPSSWGTPVLVASHKAETHARKPPPSRIHFMAQWTPLREPHRSTSQMATFLPNNSSLERTLGAPVFSISIGVKGESWLDAQGSWKSHYHCLGEQGTGREKALAKETEPPRTCSPPCLHSYPWKLLFPLGGRAGMVSPDWHRLGRVIGRRAHMFVEWTNQWESWGTSVLWPIHHPGLSY